MARPLAFKRIPKEVRRRFREGEALAVSEGNHDGDSFVATIEAKWGSWPVVNIRIRDLYLPELSAPLGPAAQAKLAALLPASTPCVLKNSEKDYAQTMAIGGRYVCDVELLDGQDIKTLMALWYAEHMQEAT